MSLHISSIQKGISSPTVISHNNSPSSINRSSLSLEMVKVTNIIVPILKKNTGSERILNDQVSLRDSVTLRILKEIETDDQDDTFDEIPHEEEVAIAKIDGNAKTIYANLVANEATLNRETTNSTKRLHSTSPSEVLEVQYVNEGLEKLRDEKVLQYQQRLLKKLKFVFETKDQDFRDEIEKSIAAYDTEINKRELVVKTEEPSELKEIDILLLTRV